MQEINKRSANTASVHQYALLWANSPDKSNSCFYDSKFLARFLELLSLGMSVTKQKHISKYLSRISELGFYFSGKKFLIN
jgi:hypothetical protein